MGGILSDLAAFLAICAAKKSSFFAADAISCSFVYSFVLFVDELRFSALEELSWSSQPQSSTAAALLDRPPKDPLLLVRPPKALAEAL